MKGNKRKTVIWYGIPAYGHICSNLYLAGLLAKKGIRVVYYSTAPFEKMILANGCRYRAYPLAGKAPDLSDGRRILKLYRLLLEYTRELLPALLREAEREDPGCIIFESLALWGRAVGSVRHIPAFSFYSIAAVRGVGEPAFFAYLAGFAPDFWRYADELPKALSLRKYLRQRYGLGDLGLLGVLMNKGDCNLMGYSRYFQPGGKGFGREYLFLGPLASRREVTEHNDFICPEGALLYVSLGTVFNRDRRLMEALMAQLGTDGPRPAYRVVMACNMKAMGMDPSGVPGNFIVRPFVNQSEIMKRAVLFISSGGMNSIHEALCCGVPCLMRPQQGEQLVNARRFERLGFGRILRNTGALKREITETIGLKHTWDEALRRRMTAVHTKEALSLFQNLWDGYDG